MKWAHPESENVFGGVLRSDREESCECSGETRRFGSKEDERGVSGHVSKISARGYILG